MKIALMGILVIVALLASLGWLLPNERTARRKAIVHANQERVFATVTDLANQGWRREISELKLIDPSPGQEQWIETPKHGPPIKFRTKVKSFPNRFEIEVIDNPQFGGHWVGTFTAIDEVQTEVEFTERVTVHGIIPKLLSYAFFNVDNSVSNYLEDLKSATESPK